MKFKDMEIRPDTLAALLEMGYEEPTEVQEKVIPLIIEGRNVVARSKTGTGKTAAFGVGVTERLVGNTARKALILAPTRELTLQVSDEIKKITVKYPLKTVAVYGGYSINPQISSLRKGADILVATPGRLLDHAERGTVDLSEFDIVVLDEADRMLDMGFRDEMDRIMDQISRERTVLLLSATVDEAILGAASRYMGEPHIVEIGEKEKPEEIREEIIEATKLEKFSKLKQLLKNNKNQRAIIFTSTKIFANRLAERLQKNGFDADALQGDMSQAAREKVLRKLHQGRIHILVATDVAARGLHIEDVGLIVNYDQARDDDTHLHRVGRTGRMGSEGMAVTFIERRETREERFREDHPDFAWMNPGYRPPSHRKERKTTGNSRNKRGKSRDKRRKPKR
ncbi:DEAD/DEAH box helicase [Candidatus Micrarchaeota archaeon]|nr:DEAD/DEAH box helicase [Candidatus Micrarchaeota archaeon]